MLVFSGWNECVKSSTVHGISRCKLFWQAGLAWVSSSVLCLRMFQPFMVNHTDGAHPLPLQGWWFGLDHSKGTDEGRCDWSRNQCWRHWTDALAILGAVPNMIFDDFCAFLSSLKSVDLHWVYIYLCWLPEDWHGMAWGSLCCSTQPSSIVCSSRSLPFRLAWKWRLATELKSGRGISGGFKFT